jgi:outer membrane receptor for ferrienterochelin and colicins
MKTLAGSLVLASAMLLGAGAARAQSTARLEQALEQTIVSTPSRSSEPARIAPATSSVITAEDLRRHGIRTLDEAIDYASLGMVTQNPLHAVEVGARGVLLTADYGNHVLLQVDGHALNEPWNGTAYFERGAGIPIEVVDHIEISLGPGSVMYGSSAMLGVINIVTKRAEDHAGLNVLGEGEIALPTDAGGALRGPSFGSGYTSDLGGGYRVGAGGGHEFTLFGLPAQFVLQAEYYAQHGPALEYAPQFYGEDAITGEPKRFSPGAPTGIWGGKVDDAYFARVPVAYGKLSIGEFDAAARVGMYERGTPHHDSLIADSGNFDDSSNRERDRFLNLDLAYRIPLSSLASTRIRAYADFNHYHWSNRSAAAEDCLPGQNEGCLRLLDGRGRILGGELQTRIDWFESGQVVTLAGIDARTRGVESRFVFEDAATGAPARVPGGDYDRSDELVAPYLQQTLRPASWLDLNLGLRGDFDSRFGSRASPRSAAAISPWEGGTLKAIYAEAFRAPTAYELLYSEPNVELPAPDLQPETVRSVEGSIEQTFGTQRVLFGVFRSWWSNMVQLAVLSEEELAAAIAQGQLAPDTEEAYQYRNTARIDNFGYNAAYEGVLLQRRLRYALNLTSAYTLIDRGDGSEPQVPTVGPQIFGNARVSYDLGDPLPTLALATRFYGSRPADRAFDGGFSEPPHAPGSLELRATVSGPVPALNGLSYRASATYATAGRGPYVVGPNQYAADETTRAELSPKPRLGGFVALEYRFMP